MKQYILLDRLKVQNANAISGFTWGFPSITHFLGFTHNLQRKLNDIDHFNDLSLNGCAVVAHEHQVYNYRTGYGFYKFTQTRNPAYLSSQADKSQTSPIIEEGKMNMTVSIIIGFDGDIGNRIDSFKKWLERTCYQLRLAGGTILDITDTELFNVSPDHTVKAITCRLLPGYILMDASASLKNHFQEIYKDNSNADYLDAWLDFLTLKQKARPKSDKIKKHIYSLVKKNPDNPYHKKIMIEWENHLKEPYNINKLSENIKKYFDNLNEKKTNHELLIQWKNYCNPNEKTYADWEYVPKPAKGYLMPIMSGYKAISKLYQNKEVEKTRDNETEVCFVESVHSIGEWKSVHRVKRSTDLENCLWNYAYSEGWYLSKQRIEESKSLIKPKSGKILFENPDDDF